MTYYVNKTDGTTITILDGTSNVTATSLTLIGKLATNYGEAQIMVKHKMKIYCIY